MSHRLGLGRGQRTESDDYCLPMDDRDRRSNALLLPSLCAQDAAIEAWSLFVRLAYLQFFYFLKT